MSIKTVNGVSFYSFQMLERWPELTQAAFTRLGGVSQPPYDTLNASFAVHDDPDKVRQNRELAARAVGWDPNRIVSAHQVHGRRVLAVGMGNLGGADLRDTDGLVTDEPGVLLLLKFADCVPVKRINTAELAGCITSPA
jgi:copper oxidase (laccase) domain-containing protein